MVLFKFQDIQVTESAERRRPPKSWNKGWSNIPGHREDLSNTGKIKAIGGNIFTIP